MLRTHFTSEIILFSYFIQYLLRRNIENTNFVFCLFAEIIRDNVNSVERATVRIGFKNKDLLKPIEIFFRWILLFDT